MTVKLATHELLDLTFFSLLGYCVFKRNCQLEKKGVGNRCQSKLSKLCTLSPMFLCKRVLLLISQKPLSAFRRGKKLCKECNDFDAGKSITRAHPSVDCVMDLPPSKSLSRSAIQKNRYIGNFIYMSFARCHFSNQESLDFQDSPLPMTLVMELPPPRGGSGMKCIYFIALNPPPSRRHNVYLLCTATPH
jgi:hypothetical protein